MQIVKFRAFYLIRESVGMGIFSGSRVMKNGPRNNADFTNLEKGPEVRLVNRALRIGKHMTVYILQYRQTF